MNIILIETSVSKTSVALVNQDKILAYKETEEPRMQASMTAPFVQEVLKEANLMMKDCSAIAVSKGPGSYTGLRVGVSTAKGLCFGAKLPLISVGTLDLLVNQAIDEDLLPEDCKYIIPMIDARRMEVYSSVFSVDGKQITDTEPNIIDENSYASYLEQGKVLFIGDGAKKCADVIKHTNAHFVNVNPKASAMHRPAVEKFVAKDFEDVAYFEPFYLKEFVATVSKKKLF